MRSVTRMRQLEWPGQSADPLRLTCVLQSSPVEGNFRTVTHPGHQAGMYSYPYLREIADYPKCRVR